MKTRTWNAQVPFLQLSNTVLQEKSMLTASQKGKEAQNAVSILYMYFDPIPVSSVSHKLER